MRSPQITRDRHGILEVAECDPAFICTRDSLEYLVRLHNEMVEQRNLLAAALEACREDSCELLGERSWWKDEERAEFRERYDATAENIVRANEALDSMKGGTSD
jgi:hypothetical protein